MHRLRRRARKPAGPRHRQPAAGRAHVVHLGHHRPAEGRGALAELLHAARGDQRRAAHRDSHFTVGDIGYLDADGFLFVTDRDANIIISGGVNIYPAEVEAALLEHPAVKDVAVVGVPDEEWGESVKAVVQLERNAHASDALALELVDYCRRHIAHFKCPRTVDFIEQLPRDDNGKLYRRRLPGAFETGQ